MSISRMTAVWSQSTHTGGDLLLLLALADAANDDGHCWPGIDELKKKTRQSEATVIRDTRRLEASGELLVDHNRRRGNSYLVVVGFDEDRIAQLKATYFGVGKAVKKHVQNSQNAGSRTRKMQVKNLQNESNGKDEMTVQNLQNESTELSPVTDDPSRTIIEPSKELKDSSAPDGAGRPVEAPEEVNPEPTTQPKPKRKSARKASTVKTRPPKPEVWGDLVVAVITHFQEPRGKAAMLAEQLAGCAPNWEERGKHNCSPSATPADIAPFVAWYRADHPDLDLPTGAEALSSWWHKFNLERKAGRNGDFEKRLAENTAKFAKLREFDRKNVDDLDPDDIRATA